MEKKIAIFNEIASDNVGDQAIAAGLNSLVRSLLGSNVEIINFGLQSGKVYKENEKTRPAKFKSDSDVPQFNFIYHVLWTLRYIFRLVSKYPVLKKVDIAIIGGGGVIMDNRLQFPTAIYICGLICRLMNIPYVITGVSCSGSYSYLARILLSRSLRNASHIDARDPTSCKIIGDISGVAAKLGADYAFSLGSPAKEVHLIEFDLLINISSAVVERAAYIDLIDQILHFYRDGKIAIVTTGDHGDEILAEYFYEKNACSQQVFLLCSKNYQDYIDATLKSKFVIATRLHAGILALLSKKTTFIIDIGYKQAGFFSGIGLHKNLIKINKTFDGLSSCVVDKEKILQSQESLSKKNMHTFLSRLLKDESK